MKNSFILFAGGFCVLFLALSSNAQFNTPTIDGVISASEYGSHTNGNNQQTNSGQVWYLSWDNTNLYVAVTNANLAEGAVIAIDRN